MAELALERRQQIMDRCRVMTPLVQGYLDAHSGIEIGDDSSRSEVTPLLIGLLVQQIFASERQTLTNEMDRIITEKLQGLTLGARHIVSDTQLTIRSKHTSLVADTQESCSVDSAPDDDDPDDSDYVDSQPTGHAISYSDSDDNEFRRSTRSNALREPEAQSPSSSPQLLPIEETPRPLRTKSSPGALTPLSTGTTSPADLSTCTPTRNKSPTPKSVGPVTKNVTGTTKRVQSLEEDAMSAKPTTKAMSSKFLFQATKKWPLATLIPTASGSIQQGDLPSPTPAAKAAPESSLFSTMSSMSSTKGQPLSKHLGAPSLSVGTTRGDKTITGGKAFRLWHKNAKISTQVLDGHNRGMQLLVAVSPDSKLVASVPIYGTVRLWRSDTGECMPTSDSGGGLIRALAFSHDSKLVLVVRNSDAVQLWRPETDKFTHIQTLGLDEFIRSAVFSPDLRFLALAHFDDAIRLWLVDSDKLTLSQVLEGHNSPGRPVTFSHDSKFMASISDDYTVRIWLADSGKFTLTQILEGHNDAVWSVAFSHDSNFIASGSLDCKVWLWCAAGTDKFKHTRTFKGHTNGVLSVAFSHDSTLLASASKDGTIRLWQTDNGECSQVLDGHTLSVRSVAFAKNSEFLASASEDMTVRLWRPHMGENDSDSVKST